VLLYETIISYEFDVDLSMAGQWNFIVTFDPNGRVQSNISSQ